MRPETATMWRDTSNGATGVDGANAACTVCTSGRRFTASRGRSIRNVAGCG